MTRDLFMAASMFERLSEFDRVAGVLDMPLSERIGILNVSELAYNMLRAGKIEQKQAGNAELTRRLSYALPLMRKLALNVPAGRPQPAQDDQAAA